MKTYSNLRDRLKISDKFITGGRYGVTHDQYMRYVDCAIGKVTGGLSSCDFADTVFAHDAWEDGVNPVDTAEEILVNDTIGEQFLMDFLGWPE